MLSVETLLQEARMPRRPRRGRTRQEKREEAERISLEIGALPEVERLALALRFYESLRPSEIGAILDRGEEEVRTLLLDASRTVIENLRHGGSRPERTSRRARAVAR